MDSLNKTVVSYLERASLYDKKMSWVNMQECISPLTPDVFGNGIALDVCAGTGAVSKALIEKGWTVISYDASKAMLSQSKLPLPILGDMHNLPFLDSFFEIIVCRQGLQYADIKLAIDEFKRVCRNQILLGHITREDGDSYSFWQDYFAIASPGRKHIFKPNELYHVAQKMELPVEIIQTITQQDNYVGPLLHLPPNEQTALVKLLIDSEKGFKALYNVKEKTDIITYSNRWEFLKINI